MATWTTTVTNKGTELQAKQVSGAKILFTRIVTSTDIVYVTKLKEQTAINNIKQTLSMASVSVTGNQYVLKVLLSNNNLSESYNLSQIGFYANDPDEGEILFAIAQIDTVRNIPSYNDAPGFGIEFAFTFQNANNATIEITPDMASYMVREDIEDLVDSKISDSVELGPDITE